MNTRGALARWTGRLRRRGTLPLRLWLVLAVVAITGAGFLAQMGLVGPVSTWEQQTEDARLANVRQIIGTDAAQWRDPTWQRHADAALAALGVEVAIFLAPPAAAASPAPSAQAIYLTSGAHRFLDAGGQDVSGAANQASAQASPETQLVFQRLVIANRAQSANRAPLGVAFLWDTTAAPGGLFGLLWTVVEWGTFALTLAIVLWLIGQPVLRPLAAMGQAAEDIAGGDLDVHLPPSPVREIAGVTSALEGMSASLRKALARQAALEQERRLFVGAVAHDLRTPLFMLRGSLKGLESGVAATPEKMARYVAICQTQANALERMISDLFAYTRLEHPEREPERLPLDLGALVRRTVEAATPLATAKGIALTADVADEDTEILGDSHLLTRAIENLLDNAVRHTPDCGAIRVSLARNEGRAVFTVADSGPGIAATDLPHLFTPLYRGEASRNSQASGVGLGLAIARRVLEAHGGSLTAGNRAEGGATFTGTLPVARRHAALATPGAPGDSVGAAAR
jgi:signal transduction histidine kinase